MAAAEVGGRSYDHHLIDDTDSEADIYEDHTHLQFDSRSSSALGGLPLGNIQNISHHNASFDTITFALSNFHIGTVSKENIQDLESEKMINCAFLSAMWPPIYASNHQTDPPRRECDPQ